MKITAKEREILIKELAERVRDMIYINAEKRVARMIDSIIGDIDEVVTDDPIEVTYTINMVSGDIIQIIGRERRNK